MKGFRVDRQTYIIGQVSRGMQVLHIGCTNAPYTAYSWQNEVFLHKSLCDRAKLVGAQVTGIDIDEDAVNYLRQKMPDEKILTVDAEKLSERFGHEAKFDLIVMADVIEHLPNPGLCLTSCRDVLADTGSLVITTANSFGIIRVAKSIFFHEAVHHDHTAYYSHKTLERLLHLSGLCISERGYYKSEFRARSLNRFVSNSIEGLATIIWNHFSEGVVVKAFKG